MKFITVLVFGLTFGLSLTAQATGGGGNGGGVFTKADAQFAFGKILEESQLTKIQVINHNGEVNFGNCFSVAQKVGFEEYWANGLCTETAEHMLGM